MPTKKKAPGNTARVTYALPSDNQPKKLVSTAEQQATTVLANPDIANHADISAAANGVKTQAQAVGTTITGIANTEATLSGLRGQRTSGIVTLRLQHANMESLVNVAVGGDKAKAATWGGKVVARTTYVASEDAPQNATGKALGGGSVEAKCKAEKSVVCYLFQIGTDPTHPEAWPQPAISGGCKHAFTGLTPGQKVYVRIAIVRRGNVQGAWSGFIEIGVT